MTATVPASSSPMRVLRALRLRTGKALAALLLLRARHFRTAPRRRSNPPSVSPAGGMVKVASETYGLLCTNRSSARRRTQPSPKLATIMKAPSHMRRLRLSIGAGAAPSASGLGAGIVPPSSGAMSGLLSEDRPVDHGAACPGIPTPPAQVPLWGARLEESRCLRRSGRPWPRETFAPQAALERPRTMCADRPGRARVGPSAPPSLPDSGRLVVVALREEPRGHGV